MTTLAECHTLFEQIMAEADEMVAAAKRGEPVAKARDRLFIAAKRLAARTELSGVVWNHLAIDEPKALEAWFQELRQNVEPEAYT